MKRRTTTLIEMSLVALLLVACVPLPAPSTPSPETQPTTAPSATVAPTATAAARVPLKDAVASMEPQDVWQNFYDLTQIPRPSHHEEQVRDFLAQFGKGLGLETIVDDVGNVLIRKPAAQGMESREGVILQAHMDMVAQSAPGVAYDPLTDPIDAYVEGDWVVADRTTLGADDGIGVAIAMAVLQSQTPPLGPIEALFTVNEEDGLDGASGLQPGLLQGSILINLDSETEGEFIIGSAGGDSADIQTTYEESALPADVAAYTVSVSGLQGGHSGADINLGRGHAIKLLVRILKEAAGGYGMRVAQIAGGTAANAIPRDASALVLVPAAQADAFLQSVQEFEGIVKSELAATEPDLSVQAAPADLPARVMDDNTQRTLIDALCGTPQGVLRMSDTVPGLVETSTNIGIVNIADGQVALACLSRSSVETELDDVDQMIASVWDLAGIGVAFSTVGPAWNPNPDSPILLLMEDVYREMYGQDPVVTAVHGGLECGTIVARYPGMDAISIGPTVQNVHSPDERLQAATVKKLADLLTETLVQIPEAAAVPAPSPAPTAATAATIQPLPAVAVTVTSPAATVTPAVAAARVPLKDAVASMEPQDVWQNFYDLTQVPRPSHHEEQVRAFMVQFGEGLGLETIVDDSGNVLIRKPAAEGMENREGVVLQAHMDMVPQKTDESTHDFLTDPIDAYVEGEWVVADGTTLGADDGIGVAIAMAVLQSETPPLGPIEALFTVNEEDGMDGGLGLQPGLLQGTILINLDWEAEGTFLISSAGGEYAHVVAPYAEVNTPDGMQAYQVKVSGLTGGHSGMDINMGLGHATKLLVRLLSIAAQEYGVQLAEITGGTAANAIPQEATALVTVPATQGDAFLKFVEEYQDIVRAELAATEPNLAVGATTADLPPVVMAQDDQRKIIDGLYGTPQGVMRMSDVVEGLVETSNNMGIVHAAGGGLDVTCYPRSSVDTELDDVALMIASVWDLGGIPTTFYGRYPGWKADPDSPILGLMETVYHDLYRVDPGVVSVHAGTECGVIQAAYPGMDAISLGATLKDVHTPAERVEIDTVKKLNDLLLATLKQIPEHGRTS